MSIPQTTASDSNSASNGVNAAWPADVLAFAAVYQAEHCLQPLLEATQRIFPTARFINVYIEDDPELRDNRQIVFDVQVAGLSPEAARAGDRQWTEELFRICPPLRKFIFCLLLDLKR